MRKTFTLLVLNFVLVVGVRGGLFDGGFGSPGKIEVVDDLQDAVAALGGFIELEVQLRGELEDDALAEFALELAAQFVELRERLVLLGLGADDADEDVRVLEIR